MATGICLATVAASAAEPPEGRSPLFQTTADMGFVLLDEDLFASFLIEQRFALHGFSIAVAGPFRLRIMDRSPEDAGVLRQQDWDTPSDFTRIVPFIAYQRRWQDGYVDLYAGELNGVTIGHGAVAAHYFNSADMDHYRAGPFVQADWAGNGLELLIDDLVAPNLLVGRAHLAPLAWFLEGTWPRRLEIGYTLGIDFKAPYRIYGTGDTSIVTTGGDISLVTVDERWGSITPYVDVLSMDGDIGVHLGIDTAWVLSQPREIRLLLLGEYRFVGADYHPALFNPFYDYNRRYFPVGDPGDRLTLADQLRDPTDLPRRHAYTVELSFEWRDRLRLGARYDTAGTDRAHWVLFRLELTPLPGYRLSAFYAGQDVNGGSNLFGVDSYIGLAIRGLVYGPIDLFFHFNRRLRRQGDSTGFANEIGGGVGASITY